MFLHVCEDSVRSQFGQKFPRASHRTERFRSLQSRSQIPCQVRSFGCAAPRSKRHRKARSINRKTAKQNEGIRFGVVTSNIMIGQGDTSRDRITFSPHSTSVRDITACGSFSRRFAVQACPGTDRIVFCRLVNGKPEISISAGGNRPMRKSKYPVSAILEISLRMSKSACALQHVSAGERCRWVRAR